MGTGRLAISRGHQLSEPPHLSLVPEAAAESPAPPAHVPPASPDYHLVHDRLTSLERLTRLFDQGALSADEFAAEKMLILGLPADELVLREPAPVHFVPAEPRGSQRGPSLLGRMLSWKFVLFSLVTGLGASFAAQPDQTIRFFDQILRAAGA
ncbi:MAG TPA: SHOCT domain-containing protein [Allosphingosinicella sp.]|nr:SHOCT domain-containing protein [Allosphingosinicella sp.]